MEKTTEGTFEPITLEDCRDMSETDRRRVAALIAEHRRTREALSGLYVLHEPEGRFQPSHFKPALRAAREALGITLARAEQDYGVHRDRLADLRLIAWGVARGLRWADWSRGGAGELCWDGIWHATNLDACGVPMLTEHLRALLFRAYRQENNGAIP